RVERVGAGAARALAAPDLDGALDRASHQRAGLVRIDAERARVGLAAVAGAAPVEQQAVEGERREAERARRGSAAVGGAVVDHGGRGPPARGGTDTARAGPPPPPARKAPAPAAAARGAPARPTPQPRGP